MPVYLIRAGLSGPVKIGKAGDVTGRLAALQTAHHETLHLLRAWQGGCPEEASLHARFAHLRLSGEWFTFDASMLGDVGLVELPVQTEAAADSAPEGTPRFILDALGGYRRVAHLLSQAGAKPVSPVRVHNWTRRAIPAEFWPDLVQVAEAERVEGITFAALRAAKAVEVSQASAA